MFQHDENILDAHYTGDEIEILQTDIQRFLAILAFCLLPVFMLVQSIPAVSDQKGPMMRELKDRIETQNETLNGLISQNSHLKAKVAQRDSKIRQLQIDRDHLNTSLKKTFQQADGADQPSQKPVSENPASSRKKGLYVAFASDTVFLNLLETGEIQLFIHVVNAEQSFRALHRSGKTHFVTGNPVKNLDLWEIETHMVPAEILDTFRKWTTLSSGNKIFIVGLSPELSLQIRQTGKHGHRIIIGPGAKVHGYAQEG